MKNALFLISIIAIVLSVLLGAVLIRTYFAIDREAKNQTIVQIEENETSVKEEEPVEEEKEEEPLAENKEEKEPEPVQNIANGILSEEKKRDREVYRMLDFDRRLILDIGQQDQWLCSIFDLAYGRAILDGSFKIDPYDYYDGDGADWRSAGFEEIASSDPLKTVLQRAYDQIEIGRPIILFVSGNYGHSAGSDKAVRHSEDHYVLLIGFKQNCDYENLVPSDFYAADPSGGYCCSVESYMPWIFLNDEAPALTSGEYALYAPIGETGVKTCLAYADSCNWDADQDKPIDPDYADR